MKQHLLFALPGNRLRWVIWLLLPIASSLLLITFQPNSNSPLQSQSLIPSTSLTAIINPTSDPPTPTAMTAGKVAPSFVLTGLDGNVYRLPELRGHDVILNFWATWCPPCKSEMPLLEITYEQLKTQGVVIIGINDKESVSRVTSFVQSMGVTFPILLDPTEGSFQNYQIFGLPITYFIDKHGQLVDENVGPLTAMKLTHYIDKLKVADQ